MSGNGQRIIAIEGGSDTHVTVYNYTTPGLLGGTWELISNFTKETVTYNGTVTTQYAYRPTINYSGNRIAYSYTGGETSGYTNNNTGRVRVHEYDSGTTWNTIGEWEGSDLNWGAAWGKDIKLNSSVDSTIDGTVIALLHYKSEDDLTTGDSWVQIYDYDGTTWNARPNIYGYIPQVRSWYTTNTTTEYPNYYQHIDVSSDGNYALLTSQYTPPNWPHSDIINTSFANVGNMIVFEYRLITQSEWDNGNTSTDYTPAVDIPVIMADGDTSLDTNKKYWIQKGNLIVPRYDQTANSKFGKLGVHEDGTLFVAYTINSVHDPDDLSDTGAIEIYSFQNNDWRHALTIYGTTAEEHLGWACMRLSKNATRYITGSFNSPYSLLIQDIGYTPEFQYKYQIHSDVSMVNAAESFGEDVSLNAALTVPGNILIVDSSNSEYNYGAYTIHTDETYTNYFAVGKSASNVFNIVNNNNAGVYMDSGSNSFTGTSDERLKKNIEEIEDESNEKVKQLRPVTYQWKHQTHNKSQAGFIAQEVEKVLPELVKENDSVDGSTYKGVSSDDLIPYLVKYVQKLRKKLEILKETKLKKSVSLSEISVSTNGGSITPSPFSSTDELK